MQGSYDVGIGNTERGTYISIVGILQKGKNINDSEKQKQKERKKEGQKGE